MTATRNSIVLILCTSVALLWGCTKSPSPPPQTGQQVNAPSPPPPPPAPPDTSAGKLVGVDRAQKVKARVVYLTTSGMSSDVQTKTARKGKTFLVLHFEGKGKKNPPEPWLTDALGQKYTEGYGYAPIKDKWQIVYEVPERATGFMWHDGKIVAYQLEPTIALMPGAPEELKK
jgi:hypothetical protein